MKVLIFVALLVAVHAHGDHGDCGGDCLKACRSCGKLENDGEVPEDGSDVFEYGERVRGDCKQAMCKDPKAKLIVDGNQYDSLRCFQGKWHFGFPEFLEETSSASCLAPGNFTCDVDATVQFVDTEFKCECKPNYEDRSEEFGTDAEEKLCSNCHNKKHNIIFLVDNSGSTSELMLTIKKFAENLIKFLKVSETGNRIALVTSAFSYEILIDWESDQSVDGNKVEQAFSNIIAEGQSYLGSGMEAVKAALVQPTHENDSEAHKLIVFTDGSVKHSPPCITDITRAAHNLEALKVETFVVVTNLMHNGTVIAIANGVENNVFAIEKDDDEETNEANFKIVNRLQKRICV